MCEIRVNMWGGLILKCDVIKSTRLYTKPISSNLASRKVIFGPHNYFLFYFSIIQKLAGEGSHWRLP